jgi:ribonuclease BN (tRNA processing enzyme)
MRAGRIRVTVFGSSAGFPTEKRTNTCIGVWRSDRELYLIDSGEPTAAYLARRGVLPDTLRAVFITHPHVDHCGGLPMLLQWNQLNCRQMPLAVFVPKEIIVPLQEFLNAVYLLPELLGFDLELRPVGAGRIYGDGIHVEALPNTHTAGSAERARAAGYPALGDSFSYRVRVDGRTLFFSGDLASPQEIVDSVAGADLAVVEMAHYTPEDLGAALAGTALPRLVVNHIIHTLEPVEDGISDRIRSAGFGGEVHVAKDGDEFEV